MSIPFKPSSSFSVGMEMEFQLLDRDSLDLVEGILPLMEFYGNQEVIKPEFIQNTVEIASLPCADVCSLEAHVRMNLRELLQRTHELRMALASAGTHPFSRSLAHVTPLPRYEAMADNYGLSAKTQITFATHVHIGVDGGDEAITLMSELKTMLPFLIALSANSPFYRGHDTGFVSYRRTILASSRNYGQPPDFAHWNSFCAFFEHSRRAGLLETINDIHWDIRPRPHLGTIEVRAMDAQATVSEACAIVGFIRALVRYLQRTRSVPETRPVQPVPWYIHKDNCFLAAKMGMEASIMTNSQGYSMPLRAALDVIFTDIEGDIVAGEEGFVETLRSNANTDSLGYQMQRRCKAEGASWRELLASQCQRLETDLSIG